MLGIRLLWLLHHVPLPKLLLDSLLHWSLQHSLPDLECWVIELLSSVELRALGNFHSPRRLHWSCPDLLYLLLDGVTLLP